MFLGSNIFRMTSILDLWISISQCRTINPRILPEDTPNMHFSEFIFSWNWCDRLNTRWRSCKWFYFSFDFTIRGHQHSIQHVDKAYHQKSSTFDKCHLHSLSQKAWLYSNTSLSESRKPSSPHLRVPFKSNYSQMNHPWRWISYGL
jgi:hypothetical protein